MAKSKEKGYGVLDVPLPEGEDSSQSEESRFEDDAERLGWQWDEGESEARIASDILDERLVKKRAEQRKGESIAADIAVIFITAVLAALLFYFLGYFLG
ncbi:MAG TPA: hypothetical protein VJH23_06145 [archaeon]|nr:hypothetical protein [archaeon]